MRVDLPAHIHMEDEHEVTVTTYTDRRAEHESIAAQKLETTAIHLTRENEWLDVHGRWSCYSSWRRNGY